MPAIASSDRVPGARASRESSAPGVVPLGRCEQLRQDRHGEVACSRRHRRTGDYLALALLSTFSALDRVRNCRRRPIGQGGVEVRHRPEAGRAHFAGLQTCGSQWACPCCAKKILAGRTDELLRAIDTHTAAGGEVLMLTLTMRHHVAQGLGELWNGLAEAWRAASSGSRSVRAIMATNDWVRRVEVTHGDNGWHVHVHALLFVAAGTDPVPIGDTMFAAWGKRLVGLGFDAPLAGPGMKIKSLDLTNAAGEVAEYLAKGHYEEAQPDPRRRAALELASTGKLARGTNRTPFQILANFVADGLACDAELWREWELASKGRRAMTWSRGARDRLVGDPELTDEQLAQETDGGGDVIGVIDAIAWPAVMRRPRLAARLLSVVETADDAADAFERLDRLLAEHGFSGALHRPPPVGLAEWEL